MKMPLCDFGKAIKIRLMDLGESQKWLVKEVRDKTGLYFDGYYLHKIMIGKLATPKIVSAIQEILELEKEDT